MRHRVPTGSERALTLRDFIQWIPVQIRLGYRPATEMFATFLSHSKQIVVRLPKIKPQPLPNHFQLITVSHRIIWRYALPQVSIFDLVRPSHGSGGTPPAPHGECKASLYGMCGGRRSTGQALPRVHQYSSVSFHQCYILTYPSLTLCLCNCKRH